jgi:hypothetical protein
VGASAAIGREWLNRAIPQTSHKIEVSAMLGAMRQGKRRPVGGVAETRLHETAGHALGAMGF